MTMADQDESNATVTVTNVSPGDEEEAETCEVVVDETVEIVPVLTDKDVQGTEVIVLAEGGDEVKDQKDGASTATPRPGRSGSGNMLAMVKAVLNMDADANKLPKSTMETTLPVKYVKVTDEGGLEILESKSGSGSNKATLKCAFCLNTFENQFRLSQHRCRDVPVKRFDCHYCKNFFSDEGRRNQHSSRCSRNPCYMGNPVIREPESSEIKVMWKDGIWLDRNAFNTKFSEQVLKRTVIDTNIVSANKAPEPPKPKAKVIREEVLEVVGQGEVSDLIAIEGGDGIEVFVEKTPGETHLEQEEQSDQEQEAKQSEQSDEENDIDTADIEMEDLESDPEWKPDQLEKAMLKAGIKRKASETKTPIKPKIVKKKKRAQEKPKATPLIALNIDRSMVKKAVITSNVGRSWYPCNYCSQYFQYTSQIMAHEQEHTGKEWLCCLFCTETFGGKTAQKYRLEHQVVGHQNQKPYRCQRCPFEADTIGEVRTHAGLCKPPKHKYKGYESMKQVHEEFNPFRKERRAIKQKKLEVVQETQPVHFVRIPKLDETKKLDYNCKKCGYGTNEKKRLADHMRIRHPKVAFKCPFPTCKMEYSRERYLARHMKIHIQPRRVQCPHCPYRSNGTNDMKIHVKRGHEQQDELKCEFCTFSSKTDHGLTSHTKWHIGKSPHKCYVCELKEFQTVSALFEHIKGEHNVKDVETIKKETLAANPPIKVVSDAEKLAKEMQKKVKTPGSKTNHDDTPEIDLQSLMALSKRPNVNSSESDNGSDSDVDENDDGAPVNQDESDSEEEEEEVKQGEDISEPQMQTANTVSMAVQTELAIPLKETVPNYACAHCHKWTQTREEMKKHIKFAHVMLWKQTKRDRQRTKKKLLEEVQTAKTEPELSIDDVKFIFEN